jgi:hypothetical protein
MAMVELKGGRNGKGKQGCQSAGVGWRLPRRFGGSVERESDLEAGNADGWAYFICNRCTMRYYDR